MKSRPAEYLLAFGAEIWENRRLEKTATERLRTPSIQQAADWNKQAVEQEQKSRDNGRPIDAHVAQRRIVRAVTG
jgi:hypothetical protein